MQEEPGNGTEDRSKKDHDQHDAPEPLELSDLAPIALGRCFEPVAK
jgi:hypothetical protein